MSDRVGRRDRLGHERRVLLSAELGELRQRTSTYADGAEVVRAIRAAAAGDAPLDPRAARAVLTRRSRETPSTSLTPREREVLALVGTGLSNKVIAIRLGISEATVKAHLTRIYQQIGVTDRTQAALWAREHNAT